MLRPTLLASALSCLAALLPAAASADVWPSKPVRVIVPYAAGGSSDVLARPWAEQLSKTFGQQFVVDNKGGASGAIGTEAASKAAPDGYTILFHPNSALLQVPQLRKVAYEWDRDFAPVGHIGDMFAGVAVNPTVVPANSMQELYAYAKAHPDELTCASAGLGTSTHMRCEQIAAKGGVKIRHIPYRGNAEALNDLLGGHVAMMTEIIVFPQVKAGKLKMLAIIDDQRHPDFPEIPTLAEAGVEDLGVPIWYGASVPKATPKEIVTRLNQAIGAIGKTEEMKARLMAIGFRPVDMPPEQIHAKMTKEWSVTGKMIKDLNIKLE